MSDDRSGEERTTWRWGEVFEVDLPASLMVKDLGDAVELAPLVTDAPEHLASSPEARIHLAVLSPLPTDPATSVRDAIQRFATGHGLAELPASHLEVHAASPGIATGRLAFVVADTAWLVLALAWSSHLVLVFTTAPGPSDPIFDRAEALLADIRPLEVVAPGAVEPDAPGEF
ncbi:MAG: hypothetical protein IT385_02970 [Deltaproteobacteria bacterium]|nr:hypothetical protein [Deltaproteobacteria bacterium]